jgi:anti-anti-sigma factor
MIERRFLCAGRTRFVAVQGALLGASARALGELFDGACRSCRAFVVDLRAVPYADSDGIRALLQLHSELAERQVRLSLVVPDAGPLRRAIHLLGFDGFLDLHQTVRQAWRAAPRREERQPA